MLCCSKSSNSETGVGHLSSRYLEKRSTDTFCFFLFVFFNAILLIYSLIALIYGNPFRLIHGVDSFGNICGKNNFFNPDLPYSGKDLRSKPFLFHLNVANISNSLKLCVEKCPDRDINNPQDLITFYRNTSITLCRYDFNFSYYISASFADPIRRSSDQGLGPCPKFPVFKSRSIINRCISEDYINTSKNIVFNFYAYLNSFDYVRECITDLLTSWNEILIMIGCAILFSYTIAFFIHILASFVAWILLVVFSISIMIVTALLWWTYADIKYNLNTVLNNRFIQDHIQNEKSLLVLSIITTVIAIILLLLALVMRKRVHLVVALFQETSKCIRSMPTLLFQPILTFFALAIFVFLWFATFLAILTSKHYVKKNMTHVLVDSQTLRNSDLSHYIWIFYSQPHWVYYLYWFHLVALFWLTEFILGCEQMVIAQSVAFWYFTYDRSKVRNPVTRAYFSLVCYHMGSIALGSFLITLFKVPRVIITYLDQKLKKYQANVFCSYILKCANCCLWCLGKFIKFLNHNAYTMIAIEGKNFCSAAQTAFDTIVSNALRIATINSVGDFILFLGKCSVAALTAFVGLLFIRKNPNIEHYSIPLVIPVVIAYFIADSVLNVYEMIIDSLFLCFCYDHSVNDGSPGKEYYAPASLMAFITKSSNVDTQMKALNSTSKKDNESDEEE